MADLTTITNVKSYLQITDNASDPVLSRLITAFSAWFLNQINRGGLLLADYTEHRNGKGGDSMNVANYPIADVVSVTVDNVSIPASVGGSPGFVFDDLSIFLIDYRFTRGRGNVQLAYSAGYTTPPADVEQAVLDQVAFTFRRQPNLGSVTQSMNGITTVSFSQKDLAPGVNAILLNYKTRTPVGL